VRSSWTKNVCSTKKVYLCACCTEFARSATEEPGVQSSRFPVTSTSGSRSTSASWRSSRKSRRRDVSATDRFELRIVNAISVYFLFTRFANSLSIKNYLLRLRLRLRSTGLRLLLEHCSHTVHRVSINTVPLYIRS